MRIKVYINLGIYMGLMLNPSPPRDPLKQRGFFFVTVIKIGK